MGWMGAAGAVLSVSVQAEAGEGWCPSGLLDVLISDTVISSAFPAGLQVAPS